MLSILTTKTRRKAMTIDRYMTDNKSSDPTKFIKIKQMCQYGVAFQPKPHEDTRKAFEYIGFTDKPALDTFITTLNMGDNYRHFFEMLLNPIRKLYIDLDFKKRGFGD